MKAVGNGFRAHARTVGTQGISKQVGRQQSVVAQPLMRVISISVVRQRATMGRSEPGAVVWDGRPSGPGTLWAGRQLDEGETKDH